MTLTKLPLSADLELPIDVVTQRLAFMGRPGSGKTYAATKLFELLVGAGVQAVAIDVVGVWYGVRLGRDGKSAGLAVPIFGGLHGDVPLEPGAGALIADLVVDRELTAVLDISQMVDHEQTKFATDFGRRFFERKKSKPSPVMLLLEECQELVPQFPMKDETMKLHVFQRISKLGRNYGIGIGLISQRPQDVNKKVFNLTELMLAFQLTAPAERRTMKEWMDEAGLDDDINALLPKLHVGQARAWSPAWLQIQKTVQIAPKETYDASATPKVGAKRVEPKALTPIDLEQITVAMRDVVERAKAEDPKALKAELARLKKELAQAAAKVLPAAVKVERIEIPALSAADIKALTSAADSLEAAAGLLNDQVAQARAAAKAIIDQLAILRAGPLTAPRSTTSFQEGPGGTMRLSSYQPREPRPPADPGTVTVTAPQQRILDALAWLESVGVSQAAKAQLALLAEQSPTSSGYTNNLGALRTAGFIGYPAPGQVQLNASGLAIANAPAEAPTTAELQRQVLARLTRPQAAILARLIDVHPHAVAKLLLAEQVRQSATSSGYTNNLGRLRSLGLIEYPAPGLVVAAPILFLEG